jgi:hypothetical protein
MGKASKQAANLLKNQIKQHKSDPDFMDMIKSMDDNKSYTLKKGKAELYNGKSMPGKYWKQLFIEN